MGIKNAWKLRFSDSRPSKAKEVIVNQELMEDCLAGFTYAELSNKYNLTVPTLRNYVKKGYLPQIKTRIYEKK